VNEEEGSIAMLFMIQWDSSSRKKEGEIRSLYILGREGICCRSMKRLRRKIPSASSTD
jgi:hypothetical protein